MEIPWRDRRYRKETNGYKGQRIYVYNGDGPESPLLLRGLWIYVRILVQNSSILFARETNSGAKLQNNREIWK